MGKTPERVLDRRKGKAGSRADAKFDHSPVSDEKTAAGEGHRQLKPTEQNSVDETPRVVCCFSWNKRTCDEV